MPLRWAVFHLNLMIYKAFSFPSIKQFSKALPRKWVNTWYEHKRSLSFLSDLGSLMVQWTQVSYCVGPGVFHRREAWFYHQLVTLAHCRSSRCCWGIFPLRRNLTAPGPSPGQRLGVLELEADSHFEAVLALNCAFLVGTQLSAPRMLENASTWRAWIYFRSFFPILGLDSFPSLRFPYN